MRRRRRLDLPVPAPPVKKILSPRNAAAMMDSCSSVSGPVVAESSPGVDGRLRWVLRPDGGDVLGWNRMAGDVTFRRGCLRRLCGVNAMLPFKASFDGVAMFRCRLMGVFCSLWPPEDGLVLLVSPPPFRAFDGVRDTRVESLFDLFLDSFSLLPDSGMAGTAERAASRKH